MDIPQDVMHLIIGLGILFGCIQCFFGFRIFKFIFYGVHFCVQAFEQFVKISVLSGFAVHAG